MAAESIQNFRDYISEILPNRVNSSTITTLLNNEMRKHWRDMASTKIFELYTVADLGIYDLPSDCEFAQIVPNGVSVSDTTNGSTNQTFRQYEYAGQDDYASGYKYYDATGDSFGLYPIPTNGNKPIHVRYKARPTLFTSADTTSLFTLDEDYIDFLRFKVMARVAKAGNNPDVEMGNNYEMDAMEVQRKMRLKQARDKMKTARKSISYKEGWDSGWR